MQKQGTTQRSKSREPESAGIRYTESAINNGSSTGRQQLG